MNQSNRKLLEESLFLVKQSSFNTRYNFLEFKFTEIINKIETNWGKDFSIVNSQFSIEFLLNHKKLICNKFFYIC